MKIAIASDEGRSISSHFGRTKGFVIFDVEGNEIKSREYRNNTFTGHARGLEGAGHNIDRHGPIITALKDCSTVIAHGMGKRIYNDLKEAGINVFITGEVDIEKVIALYLKGELVDKPNLGCDH
ncbi:MAG: iron-molybdenum cofactor biosynthesis protein [Bacteroidetes bacterium]|nr:iron-molybdenum cofactor biosynthesis protein [Bacteroidota bacterium]MBU1423476.1 iron-molybdenum cofactor biosynthesis protein [Bacteroidota bacterium]MBU2472278.1 iron-molybdenum cofactor biosynthesis protein [Bacteroidota bacterium]MBU2636410.1 iron-molybdenum cofactor biosynthesis protein [Bacteroidota bacterium]